MNIENFKIGTGTLPESTFSLIGTALPQHNKMFEKLFNAVGGVDNLVFYKTTDTTTVEVVPVSVFMEDGRTVYETCFKVLDISKVSDLYKSQVEVESILVQ